MPLARVPSETADDNVPGKQNSPTKPESASNEPNGHTQDPSENQPEGQSNSSGQGTPPKNAGERKPAPRGAEPFDASDREEMENLLGELCGHLGAFACGRLLIGSNADSRISVVYPNRFLEGEDIANNFLFNADRLVIYFPRLSYTRLRASFRLMPLPIYD